GVHAVELRFDPESLIAGKRITCVGIVAFACILLSALFASCQQERTSGPRNHLLTTISLGKPPIATIHQKAED
ncbi:MAG: hypothetical protein NTU83_05655, partial [Candidatus Hydrogenedentes bacterium]|nr:hypothetical protein [Candidatus Hydrogenedentota bacterium]